MDSAEVRFHELPPYTTSTPEVRDKLCQEMGIFDQERMIFEALCEYAEDNLSGAWIEMGKFIPFLSKKALPGLTLEINVSTHARKLASRLAELRLCKVVRGTPEEPLEILLTDPNAALSQTSSQNESYLETLKNLVDDRYKDISQSAKTDIPFPTKEAITEHYRREINQKVEPAQLWEGNLIRIKVDDFTKKFIDNAPQTGQIIQIDFNEENNVLMTPESAKGLFQSVLAQKVLDYVQDNPGIQDRIRVVLKQNKKESPDIKAIFSDIGTDVSFFWILTFKKIMEYLHTHKSTQAVYLHYYEASCLLYQYSMHQREVDQEEIREKEKKRMFRDEFQKAMIQNYTEPWTFERIQRWQMEHPSPLMQDTISPADFEEFIESINNPAKESGAIVPILSLVTKEKVFYMHKYRFAQLFLITLQKETSRLKDLFIRRWADQPVRYDSDFQFDHDLENIMSDFFFGLLFKIVPAVFSNTAPKEQLFPDMVNIKNMGLQSSDLADPAKHNVIFEALAGALFTKRGSLEIKPLNRLFNLDYRVLQKLAREYSLRKRPFYTRGIFWLLFGWIVELIEFAPLKEEIRNNVARATSLEDLKALADKYREHRLFPFFEKTADKRREELRQAKTEADQKNKDAELEKQQESDEKRKARIEALKGHFLKNRSFEELLAEYSKAWNQRIGKAHEETEANVREAILALLRRLKHFKVTREEIEVLAERVVKDPAFTAIVDKASLHKWVSLMIFQKLLPKL